MQLSINLLVAALATTVTALPQGPGGNGGGAGNGGNNGGNTGTNPAPSCLASGGKNLLSHSTSAIL